MFARRLPINTKTKLDLTKLFYSWNFTIPFLFGANVRINHILTNYNRQNSLFTDKTAKH